MGEGGELKGGIELGERRTTRGSRKNDVAEERDAEKEGGKMAEVARMRQRGWTRTSAVRGCLLGWRIPWGRRVLSLRRSPLLEREDERKEGKGVK